jgi:DNA polymerase-3 subunit epsilon
LIKKQVKPHNTNAIIGEHLTNLLSWSTLKKKSLLEKFHMHTSIRQACIATAVETVTRKPVYFDTETTGTGPYDQIIEIGIINHEGKTLLQALVKPRGGIPPDAVRVHGITNEMVDSALSWDELWPDVERVFSGQVVAAYNADFDVRMLMQSHTRNGMVWKEPWTAIFDIMELYARFHGEWDARKKGYRWHKLEQAGKHCGISLPNAHRAVDDALLARAVLEHIAAQGKEGNDNQLSMF